MILALLAALTTDPCICPAALLDSGHWERARESFLDLYASGHTHAAHGLGIALLELGDHEGAVACLSEVAPSESYGAALYVTSRYAEAAMVYAQLVSDDPLTLYNLAVALDALGEDCGSWFVEIEARVAPGDELELLLMQVTEEIQ